MTYLQAAASVRHLLHPTPRHRRKMPGKTRSFSKRRAETPSACLSQLLRLLLELVKLFRPRSFTHGRETEVYAGFSVRLHYPRNLFRYMFLSHSHMSGIAAGPGDTSPTRQSKWPMRVDFLAPGCDKRTAREQSHASTRIHQY